MRSQSASEISGKQLDLRDSRVVDQHVGASETPPNRSAHSLCLLTGSHIAAIDLAVRPPVSQLLSQFSRLRRTAAVNDGDAVSRFCESPNARSSDPRVPPVITAVFAALPALPGIPLLSACLSKPVSFTALPFLPDTLSISVFFSKPFSPAAHPSSGRSFPVCFIVHLCRSSQKKDISESPSAPVKSYSE